MSIDKIVCVGKNYLNHAMEFGEPVPEKPVLFLKPPSVLKQAIHWGDMLTLDYPNHESSVQPECEIVLKVGFDGYRMTKEEAKKAIVCVTLGLDMTLRSHQTVLKKQGHPWTTSKVFKDAAVLGPWIAMDVMRDYLNILFEFSVGERLCQSAKGCDMMMSPDDLLVYISQYFPLKAGDIIFTGTPAGVTDIACGDCAQLQWGQYALNVKWI